MSDHTIYIPMILESDYNRKTYGIEYQSLYVYRMEGRGLHNPSHPHRIQAWDNACRPNVDPSAPGPFNSGVVGPGEYIGPDRKGTDHRWHYVTAAESVAITNSGTNTGTVASGQVYAGHVLAVGDVVRLVFPDGSASRELRVTARSLANPILAVDTLAD